MIDWRAAQRIGELVAGSPPFGGVRSATVEPLVREFAGRVGAYSGLSSSGELPALELVDRPGWIAANLETMRPLLAPITEPMQSGGGPLAGPLRSASGLLLGVQVGALTGMLSQRVLGQYDLALLDASVSPRLLLLAPNLAQAARTLGRRPRRAGAVGEHPRDHARGAVRGRAVAARLSRRDAEGADRGAAGDALGRRLRRRRRARWDERRGRLGANGKRGGWAPSLGGWASNLPDPAQLRAMVERARRGELLRLTLGEDRWALVERMQAAMSLIEGHAEHTMDAVGAEVLPSLPRLRAAMNRRRESRGLPWRVLERLLGLELKLRQYELGRRFCDAVVDAGGPQALALAWSGPDALPSPAELERPELWIARVAAPVG